MAAILEFARAKINLTLHVGRRRTDGYHEIESLVVFADVGDTLEFVQAKGLTLALDGPFADPLGNEPDNLVLRAARALAKRAGIDADAHIALTKNLPIASGIGGGSADAAAALRGLRRLWNLPIDDDTLKSLALPLGADIPACIEGVPVHMEGIGERLTPLAGLPPLDMVLVNPAVTLQTAEVFARLEQRSGTDRPLPGFPTRDSLIGYLDRSSNDLEAPARRIAPAISEAIEAICYDPSTLIVRMSGSGATCFGIYDNAADAATAASVIAREHPDWWVKVAKSLPSP